MIELILFFELVKEILKPANLFLSSTANNQDSLNLVTSSEEFLNLNEFQKIQNFPIDSSKISAKAILIKEITGPTIYSQNSDKPLPIASLTKILTALTSFIVYKPNETFTVSENSKYFEAQTNFQKGEIFKRDDLIKAMLISSSNASALLLAEKYGEEQFVNQMNNLARKIGLKKSFFEDPTGLSSKNVSSLSNIYLLSEYILKNYPQIFAFSREPSFILEGNFKRILYNTNPLVYKYKEEILASKTGFTDEAGECLVMIVKFKNSPLVFLGILGSKNRINDAEYILDLLKKYYNQ